MQLAVVAEVADLLAQRAELGVDRVAPPEQGGDQQQQRQEEQRPLLETGAQFLQRRQPGHRRQLGLEALGGALQPAEIQRLVAGNPEHLLVEGIAERARGVLQLLLVQLQGDRGVEQRIQLAIEAVEQLAAGGRQVEQRAPQLRGHILLVLPGQQLLDIGAGIASGLAALVQLELVQADVGDLVGEVLVQLQARQCLLLLVENARQQQAALEHRDLLLQRLVGLVEGVELLAGLQVLLVETVEALGGAQQVVGELEVLGALGGEQLVRAGLLHPCRELGDGLLRFGAALLVDQGLQCLGFLFGTGDAFGQQVTACLAQVLQLAVAGKLLAAQLDLGIERDDLGVQQGAAFLAQRLARFAAVLEQVVDFLNACLRRADLRLGPFRTGLRGDDHAVGRAELLLPLRQFLDPRAQALLERLDRLLGVALGGVFVGAGLELGQLALGLGDLLRGLRQQGLEFLGALVAGFGLLEQTLGLLAERQCRLGFAFGGGRRAGQAVEGLGVQRGNEQAERGKQQGAQK